MKKILVVALVIAIALIGASASFASIANSKHDMTAAGTVGTWTGRHLSSCQFCHTPHNPTSQSVAPLWNRNTTAFSGTQYSFWATTATAAPGAQTMTCLTCHDGVTSILAAVNKQGQGVNAKINGTQNGAGDVNGAGVLGGTSNIGTDLSNDHPVGVIFQATGTYAGVAAPTTLLNTGVYVVPGTPYRGYGASSAVAKVECASCHNPHGDDYTANTVNSPFLRGSIETICSDCHTTK
jgi:predicted CXXCH cytochrome family protein